MAMSYRCSRDGELYAAKDVVKLNGAVVAKKNLSADEKKTAKVQNVERSGYDESAVEETANETEEESADEESDDESEDSGDKYDEMDYKQLQGAAKDRENVKGNLPEDELREALRADDASEE